MSTANSIGSRSGPQWAGAPPADRTIVSAFIVNGAKSWLTVSSTRYGCRRVLFIMVTLAMPQRCGGAE
jgi:hypothetical protein